MITEFIHTPLLRKPSAWLPLVLSLSALLFILAYVATFGVQAPAAQQDEGTPARIFQLLMVVQLPMMLYFGLRWLPQQPRQTALILVAQVAVWFIPMLTILWLES